MKLSPALVPLLFFLIAPGLLRAQYWEDEPGEYRVDWGGYLWGLKGGASLGRQDWSGLETELAVLRHASLFYQTIPSRGRFSLYGQIGYHERGSRTGRRLFNVIGGGRVTSPSDKFVFRNISLGAGGQQVVSYTRVADLYYRIGLRLEYTLDTNLDDYADPLGSNGVNFRADYPIEDDEYVRRLVYGASVGAGALFPISDRIGGFVEITAHPDVSFQYSQGAIPNVIDPSRPNGTRTIGERSIRNFTAELSVGLRFLRKWRYVD